MSVLIEINMSLVNVINGFVTSGQVVFASSDYSSWNSVGDRSTKDTVTILTQLYQRKHQAASIARPKIQEKSTSLPIWKAEWGIESSEYQDHLDERLGQGYHLVDVSAYIVNDCVYYATIWDSSATAAWKTRSRMSHTLYQELLDTFMTEGFRPSRVNGYTISNTVLYNVLWEKSSGKGWYTKFGMTNEELQESVDYYTSKGYWLKYVSGYSTGSDTHYAAIWERDPRFPWAAKWGLTISDYQIELDAKISDGYRLVHVNVYTVNDVPYFAAIWEKSPGGRWSTKGSMSSDEFKCEFDANISKGYRVKHICGYSIESLTQIRCALGQRVDLLRKFR